MTSPVDAPLVLGKLIAQIHVMDLCAIDRRLAPLGLGRGTFGCLMLLYERDGRRQEELSSRLGVNRSTIARSVRRLVELGYVRREADPDDRRAYRLWLRQSARSIRPQVQRVLRENGAAMLEGATPTERAALVRRLEAVRENLAQHVARLKGSPEGNSASRRAGAPRPHGVNRRR